jgi:hypothetical protein
MNGIIVSLYEAINLDGLVKVVTPVKTGVQTFGKCSKKLDSGFRRNDRKGRFLTFYESVNRSFRGA